MALKIEWDVGPHAKLDTKDIADELEKATLIFAATGKRLRKLPIDTTALKQPV